MPEDFDPYYTWLAIPPEEQPPDYYRLLGVPRFESNPDVITHAADQRSKHLRAFQTGKHWRLSQKLLNEVTAARLCLLNPEKKAKYDEQLRQQIAAQAPKPAPPRRTTAPVEQPAEAAAEASQPAVAAPNQQSAEAAEALAVSHTAPGRPVPSSHTAQSTGGKPRSRSLYRRQVKLMLAIAVCGATAVAILAVILAVTAPKPGSTPQPQPPEVATTLLFDIPAEQRTGLKITVGGNPVAIPQSGPITHQCAPGTYRIVATRDGYLPAIQEVTLQPGETRTVAPRWEKRPQLVVQWPQHERQVPRVEIDGRPYDIPSDAGQAEIQVPVEPGKRHLKLFRAGHEPFELELTVAPGQELRIRPVWKPLATVAENPAGPPSATVQPGNAEEMTTPDKPSEQTRPAASTPVVKAPVPSASELAQAERKLAETVTIAASAQAAEKRRMAYELFGLGMGIVDSPADQFVLLKKSMEAAAEAGEPALAFRAADELAERFEFDPLPAKQQILAAIAPAANDSSRIKQFVEFAELVIDSALAQSRFEAAAEVAAVANGVCQRAQGKAFRKVVRDRMEEIPRLQSWWQQHVQPALELLKEKPDDPDANLTAGVWYALKLCDWERGLPYLARCGDRSLRNLAEQELNAPPHEPVEQIKLADAWWDLAQQRKNPKEADSLRLHAATWYEPVQPLHLNTIRGLSTLDQVRLDKRMADVARMERRLPHNSRVPRVIENSLGMKLVLVSAGEFEMGSSPAEIEAVTKEAAARNASPNYTSNIASEGPQHRVRISKPFYIGMYEVTQGEYVEFLELKLDDPTKQGTVTSDELKAQLRASPAGKLPIKESFAHAQAFCQNLSNLPAEKQSGRVYRLPTEAEWEYACRAGSASRFSFGDGEAALAEFAWYAANSSGRVQPVGMKRPNPWGLYDMHGNLPEWCADFFAPDYYRHSPGVDPRGPTAGSPLPTARVVRGGGYAFEAFQCRSAARDFRPEGTGQGDVGFRVVCAR
mgnify:CR=1 FL=1